MLTSRRRWLLGGVMAALALAGGWWSFEPSASARLRAFVHQIPPVPIVFTSRTEPASFRAAAPSGEGFIYPGQPLWQAREGRLRLLTPRGDVHELTWEKALPDGGTLIDVMSPTVSADGRKIVFAGRRADDHGRFRLYEIGVDGRGLRQLTGGPDDAGCTALPPLRYASDGTTLLASEVRCRVDYDDVDPAFVDRTNGFVAFASSRTPDLGRGQARRSTTLWLMHLDGGQKYPLTANRYNDRWPFLTAGNFLAFSLWSHNQEVISADETDVRPYQPGQASATAPVDAWIGAFTQFVGTQMGYLIKTPEPVWRPRPLFNGRMVFMTIADYPSFDPDASTLPALQVAQAEPGLLHNVPSARPVDRPLPAQQDCRLWRGPAADANGRQLSLATPSPCPTHHVVLAGASYTAGAAPAPGAYGIYLADDNWDFAEPPAPARVGLTILFDDPDMVDSEPVAVYARHSRSWGTNPAPIPANAPTAELRLADGTTYRGPAGAVLNSALYHTFAGSLPGQRTDTGAAPIFEPPAKGSLHTIRFYASRRDRFDDPVQPRIPGAWELLAEAPVSKDTLGVRLPAGVPTVLAGFSQSGHVVRWTTAAKDSQGRQATFYALAGDHYSAVRPAGKHTCVGCHPGHSGLEPIEHFHTERIK